jgi:hypothetical protein
VSSTAAGRSVGIAKEATVVAARVLDCDGAGSISNVVAGETTFPNASWLGFCDETGAGTERVLDCDGAGSISNVVAGEPLVSSVSWFRFANEKALGEIMVLDSKGALVSQQPNLNLSQAWCQAHCCLWLAVQHFAANLSPI